MEGAMEQTFSARGTYSRGQGFNVHAISVGDSVKRLADQHQMNPMPPGLKEIPDSTQASQTDSEINRQPGPSLRKELEEEFKVNLNPIRKTGPYQPIKKLIGFIGIVISLGLMFWAITGYLDFKAEEMRLWEQYIACTNLSNFTACKQMFDGTNFSIRGMPYLEWNVNQTDTNWTKLRLEWELTYNATKINES